MSGLRAENTGKDKAIVKEGAQGAGGPDKKASRKRQVLEIVEAIAIALVLALVIRTFVIQAFKIPSGSMEDTLLIGDHIIVSKFSYGIQAPRPAVIRVLGLPVPFLETRLVRAWGGIKTGDVVVFRYPDDRTKDFIKRVVGLPGDAVEVRDRAVYINGARWDDPYGVQKGGVFGEVTEKNLSFGPYTVPEGKVFVMGDNRDRSSDSRYWGPVPIEDIRGKAFVIYWSWDRQAHWVRLGRIASLIH
jgi:signal peptidase I